MKYRNGFVSNSSSSSFIVGFKERPKSVEEMQKLLFGEKETFSDSWGDHSYPASQVAKTIFDDLTVAMKKGEVVESLNSGWLPGINYNSFKKAGTNDIDWDAYNAACKKKAGELAEEFIEKNSDCKFYEFEYSDNDGSYYCTLEHGGVFDNLPHKQISHH